VKSDVVVPFRFIAPHNTLIALLPEISFVGTVRYENNKTNAGYTWESQVRYGGNTNQHFQERGISGTRNTQSTTNYADSFYFYTGSGVYREGIVALYAITL